MKALSERKRPRLSRQARVVLALVVTQPNHLFPMQFVAEQCQSPHGSRASARASLSRTLRRLHRDKLIELATASCTTFATYHADIDRQLAQVERDPEAAFRRAVAKGAFEESPEDYLRTARLRAASRHRNIKARYVRSTPEGWAALQRLSATDLTGHVKRGTGA